MTPAEFKATRASLGKTQAALARALGVHIRTVQKWEGGERGIPNPVALAMKMTAAQGDSAERG